VISHSDALRALGIATVAYAALLAVMPIEALRLSSRLDALLQAPPAREEPAAQAGAPPAPSGERGRHAVLRRAWYDVAPALVLSDAGVLGGILLALRRRAGPWIVLVFALWPLARRGYRSAWGWLRPPQLAHLPDPTSVPMLRARVLGVSFEVELSAFWTWVQVGFALLALGILAWAFVAGRRLTRTSRGTLPAAR